MDHLNISGHPAYASFAREKYLSLQDKEVDDDRSWSSFATARPLVTEEEVEAGLTAPDKRLEEFKTVVQKTLRRLDLTFPSVAFSEGHRANIVEEWECLNNKQVIFKTKLENEATVIKAFNRKFWKYQDRSTVTERALHEPEFELSDALTFAWAAELGAPSGISLETARNIVLPNYKYALELKRSQPTHSKLTFEYCPPKPIKITKTVPFFSIRA